jgi:hypothetical protein
MKIRITELRKIIKECILLEEVGAKVPKITPMALRNVFSKREFNITPLSLRLENIKLRKNPVKDLNQKFEVMIRKVVEDLNYVAMDYALSSLPDPSVGPDSGTMMSDEQSLDLVRSVLADPTSYAAILPEGDKEIPEIISKNMDALVKEVADHFELTMSSRTGMTKRDDEKIVVDVMQAIYRLMFGHDKSKGLSIVPDLFISYDMNDEAKAANDALSDLTRLHKLLKSDEEEGKFKEFTNKFSKSLGKSSLSRDEIPTRRE